VNDADFRTALVNVLRGPIYRDERDTLWRQLLTQRRRVDEYVQVIGLTLIVDEVKGYAFLKSNLDDDDPDAPPRLIPRRALSYPVSLLLALLRRRLAEFDATSSDARLILSRDDMVRILRDLLAPGSNEARIVDRIDSHIKRAVELGFLRELPGEPGQFEVRRILESFVDAQWLADFDSRLAEYAEGAG
jgi:Domain of unknown function (DUF4194)